MPMNCIVRVENAITEKLRLFSKCSKTWTVEMNLSLYYFGKGVRAYQAFECTADRRGRKYRRFSDRHVLTNTHDKQYRTYIKFLQSRTRFVFKCPCAHSPHHL